MAVGGWGQSAGCDRSAIGRFWLWMAHHPRRRRASAASRGQRRLDGILEPAKRAGAAYFVQEQTPQLVVNDFAK